MKRDTEIKKISSLFLLYKDKFIAPQQTVITATIKVIAEVTGLTLNPTQCSYTVATKTLTINAPALLRQEIKRQQVAILKQLKAELPARSVPQVIL